jgi:hypothetical protein
MNLGDKIKVNEMIGVVVAILEDGKFSPKYPATEWAYLMTGLLVETAEAGLIHYPDTNDLEIVRIAK